MIMENQHPSKLLRAASSQANEEERLRRCYQWSQFIESGAKLLPCHLSQIEQALQDPELWAFSQELAIKGILCQQFEETNSVQEYQQFFTLDQDKLEDYFDFDDKMLKFILSKIVILKKNQQKRYYDREAFSHLEMLQPSSKDRQSRRQFSFFNIQPKQHQKSLIKGLIFRILSQTNEYHEEIFKLLFKIISQYRIIVPYVFSITHEGKNIIQHLLLQDIHTTPYKYKLLMVLMVRSSFLFDNFTSHKAFNIAQARQNASETSEEQEKNSLKCLQLSDLLCAKAIQGLFEADYSSGNYHPILSCLFLQQISIFHQYCNAPFNEQKPITLYEFYQEMLKGATPLQYLVITQLIRVKNQIAVMKSSSATFQREIVGKKRQLFDNQIIFLSPIYVKTPIGKSKAGQKKQIISQQLLQQRQWINKISIKGLAAKYDDYNACYENRTIINQTKMTKQFYEISWSSEQYNDLIYFNWEMSNYKNRSFIFKFQRILKAMIIDQFSWHQNDFYENLQGNIKMIDEAFSPPAKDLCNAKILQVSDETAKRLLQGIFYKFDYCDMDAFETLYSIQQCNKKTISTIIAIIRALGIKDNSLFMINIIQIKLGHAFTQQQQKLTKNNAEDIRIFLLTSLQKFLNRTQYWDNEFLAQNISQETYFEGLNYLIEYEENIGNALFQFGLKYHLPLTVPLIRRLNDLPRQMLAKIVYLMNHDQMPQQLYNNLQNFNQNQQFARIFQEQFSYQQLQQLNKVLKYKFSHHQEKLMGLFLDILQIYDPEQNEIYHKYFLLNIFQYFIENRHILMKFEQKIRKKSQVFLSIMRQQSEIWKYPIRILFKMPGLFNLQIKKQLIYSSISLLVTGSQITFKISDREKILQQSFKQYSNLQSFSGWIRVDYVKQQGFDCGGLTKQWFDDMSTKFYESDYPFLERKRDSKSEYKFHSLAYYQDQDSMEFFGWFVGKAIALKQKIKPHFTQAFYKSIIGQQLQESDARQEEPSQSFQSIKTIPTLSQDKFQLLSDICFVDENQLFGEKSYVTEIIPDGRFIGLTYNNRQDYAKKKIDSRLCPYKNKEFEYFLRGLYKIIPKQVFSVFSPQEIEIILTGEEVNAESINLILKYKGFDKDDLQLRWFKQLISIFDQNDLKNLLKFITGSCQVPEKKITINKFITQQSQFPHVKTCDNQFYLPTSYTSFQNMKQIIQIAIRSCKTFGLL